jgi:hypothetical protein
VIWPADVDLTDLSSSGAFKDGMGDAKPLGWAKNVILDDVSTF